MIIGLDLNETTEYVLSTDKENPTVWKLGVIPSYIFARISAEGEKKEIEMAYKILQVAIKGWDNFTFPFETVKEKLFGREMDVVPISLLEKIPIKVITELSMEVMKINQITEPERKN